jgi:hypothetical protein
MLPPIESPLFRAGRQQGCTLRQLSALSLLTQRHPCCQKRRDVRFYDYSTLPVVATRREGGSCPSVRAVAPPRSSSVWCAQRRDLACLTHVTALRCRRAHPRARCWRQRERSDLTDTRTLQECTTYDCARCRRPSRREICPSQTGLSIFKARSVAFRPRPSHVTLCLFPTTSLNLGVEGTRQGVSLALSYPLIKQRSTTPLAACAPKPA